MAALCAVAGLRIFFGAAALPFFADTDENAHFDVIHKFARGNWPARNATLHDPETIDVWILDGSPEFLNRPGTLGVKDGFPPPVRDWQRGPIRETYIQQQRASPGRGMLANQEAHEPPVYYALAAAWYECGRAFGLSVASAIYWVRFLNVLLYAALVALAYVFCQPYFGRDMALCVAALTAFFPNTVFFTINADVLSPLVVLLALVLLLRWYEQEQPGPWLAAGAGLLAAMAVLIKLTNTAILAVAGVLLALRLWRDRRPKRAFAESWLLIVAALLPPLLWALRNRLVLGEWTGTSAKIHAQTWMPNPPGKWLEHPLFTPGGLAAFLKALCVSYFAGDANWHAEQVRSKLSEAFFLATASVLPLFGLAAALYRGRREPRARLAASIAALLILAYLGELSFLSLCWDFGSNPFPSRAFPFFAFGRLAAGALVPFLALYAYGISALVGRRPMLVAAATLLPIAAMVAEQAAYLRLAIDSQYNWFHLP